MTWKPDVRVARKYGDITMTPERDGSETAHLVEFPGGPSVRVLPDGVHSGAARSRVVRDACERAARLSSLSVDLNDVWFVLFGAIALNGMQWEIPESGETFEEWLTDVWDVNDTPGLLVAAMSKAGWKVAR